MQKTTFYQIVICYLAFLYDVRSNTTIQSDVMDCPEKCVCENDSIRDVKMSCFEVYINEFPNSTTGNLVRFLDLSYNDITDLSPFTFESFKSVETIVIAMSFISNIHSDTFKDLKNLTNLDLNGNNIRFFDPLLFTDNNKLVSLILSGNPLMISGVKPFLVSPSLKLLDLSFCRLTNLTPDAFSMVPNLEVLDLSSNSLRSLSVNTLKSMTKLLQVNLGNNMWSCDCGTSEVIQLSDTYQNSASRRTPLKCFDSFGNAKEMSQVDTNVPCEEVLQDSLYNDTDDEVYMQTLPDTNETILEKYEEEIIVDEDSIIVRIVNKVYQLDDESNPISDKENENLPNDSFVIYENQQIIAFSYDEDDFEVADDKDTKINPQTEKHHFVNNYLRDYKHHFVNNYLRDYLKWNILILPFISFIISFSIVVAMAICKYRCKSSTPRKNVHKIAHNTSRKIPFFTAESTKRKKLDDEKYILIENV